MLTSDPFVSSTMHDSCLDLLALLRSRLGRHRAAHAPSIDHALRLRMTPDDRAVSGQIRQRDRDPRQGVRDPFEVSLVRGHDRGDLLECLRGDQDVAVEAFGGDLANAALLRPQPRSGAPCRRRYRKVTKLSCELVESVEAPARVDPQELPAELIVGNLRHEELVLSSSAAKPGANIAVLAGMADLAEYARVEHEPHGCRRSRSVELGRKVTGSRSSTLHSGSLETSSASHRSSIAATRAARSAIS